MLPAMFDIDSSALAVAVGASARIAVNAGAANLNGGSTFNANSMLIANTGGVGITRMQLRLEGDGDYLSLLPNIAFDPATDTDGLPAGDAIGKNFTRDSGSVGSFSVSATLTAPFEGGYQVLTLDFVGFDPGETLSFSIDIDPVSTKEGDGNAANQAGKVSGVELIGSLVTVTFDGGVVSQAELFTDGSLIGAEAFVHDGLAAAPALRVAGIAGTEGIVSGLSQTVSLTGGVAGARVRLLITEAAAYRVEPDNGYVFDQFEANKVIAVRSQFVTLDANGAWTGTVALSNGPDAEDGFNILSAALVDAAGDVIGLVSDPVTLRIAPNTAPVLVAPLADQRVLVGAAIDFSVPAGSFDDPDAGQFLTLSASGLPSGATFDAGTAEFGGSVAGFGRSTVTVTATDPSGAQASDGFVLTVALGLTGADDNWQGTGVANFTDGLAGNDSMNGAGGQDALWGGAGNDTLIGGGGADELFGEAGADLLRGGDGNDTLVGGGGIDRISSGAGADRLVIVALAEAGDTFLDFASGQDRLELSAAGFSGGLAAGANLAAQGRFVSNTAGSATTPGLAQFVLETDVGILWFDADGSGPGTRDLVARFGAGATLVAADLIIVA